VATAWSRRPRTCARNAFEQPAPSAPTSSAAARRFFIRALRYGPAPVEVTTDQAGPYLRVLDELVPAAAHITEQYANNRIEADHARLKARLRPMRGLKQFQSAAGSLPAMRSCRTSAVATPNSQPTLRHTCASRPPSPSSL
jgi:transposase-like protein